MKIYKLEVRRMIIKVLDHLIIGEYNYLSMKEEGII